MLRVADQGSASHTSGVPGTLEALAQAPGLKTVVLTPGDADFAPGPVRFSFLVVAKDGRLVAKPKADVWIARGFKDKPYQRTVARLEQIGAPGSTTPRSTRRRSTSRTFARPLRARTGCSRDRVGRRSAASATSSFAPGRIRRPSARRRRPPGRPHSRPRGGKLAPLTTAKHPDRQLYTTSVAQALDAHEPFVVTFATPKFCTSRTCGPVVDVVSYVRKQLARSGVRFIHVEVFQDNDPAKGYNRWMRQWNLQSEPWSFLVGRDGRIKEKFEGPVSVRELRAAVESMLVA